MNARHVPISLEVSWDGEQRLATVFLDDHLQAMEALQVLVA